jgi:predicted transcriptional regulator
MHKQLLSKLEAAHLPSVTGQTESFRALEAYIDQQTWRIAEVRAGLEEARRGEFSTTQEMQAIFAKYAGLKGQR